MPLTDVIVRNLKPEEKAYKKFDGAYDELSLKDARRQRDLAREKLYNGQDPGELRRRMRAAFERDLVVSGGITLHEWQRRGMVVRLKELFGRMWEYWL